MIVALARRVVQAYEVNESEYPSCSCNDIMYQDERVELLNHGFQCRTKEKPQYPEPGAHHGVFAVSLDVTVWKCSLRMYVERKTIDAHVSSLFTPMGLANDVTICTTSLRLYRRIALEEVYVPWQVS